MSRKPKDGERSLRGILSVLLENDVSPFEVTQSGLVPALLAYLTKPTLDGHDEITRSVLSGVPNRFRSNFDWTCGISFLLGRCG